MINLKQSNSKNSKIRVARINKLVVLKLMLITFFDLYFYLNIFYFFANEICNTQSGVSCSPFKPI